MSGAPMTIQRGASPIGSGDTEGSAFGPTFSGPKHCPSVSALSDDNSTTTPFSAQLSVPGSTQRQPHQRRASGASAVSSSPPASAFSHGRRGDARQLKSRHVPPAAEALIGMSGFSSELADRFDGLMSYLKGNRDADELWKQAMAAQIRLLVPEEFAHMLAAEFERRCRFGERTNTELMKTAKFVGLLKDAGIVVNFNEKLRPGCLEHAVVDHILAKVIHDCDYGGRRLTYEMFCKALYMCGCRLRPDMSPGAAFAELIGRLASACQQADKDTASAHILSEDALLLRSGAPLLALNQYRSELTSLFYAFSGKDLPNALEPVPGVGIVRSSERACWERSGAVSDTTCEATSALAGSTAVWYSICSSPVGDWCLSTTFDGDWCADLQAAPAWPSTDLSLTAGAGADPYCYANGVPVIPRRTRHMSADQFLAFCRSLRIVPELCTKPEAVDIFKRVQVASEHAVLGGSLYQFIDEQQFLDAVGQLALVAFSKPPLAQEFKTTELRVKGFLRRILPPGSRQRTRERLVHTAR
eukprot:TRINITY_DN18034_c0_g1_i1.p1 TRINITY_DN18034_c0_g1~~TRINITY_DN18034_c0_g1_i1.p1  ORF type:complete len:544 (-),score=115.58 TRINITY_DN18034_c0_g1_i1:62-1645(-)